MSKVNNPISYPTSATSHEPLGARPVAAAGFAAGMVYAWTETIFRILGTETTFASYYRLWQPRDGFITAMWLTEIVAGLVVFLVLGFVIWKHHEYVGKLRTWALLFMGSAISAPLLGEIGTPVGTTSPTGTTSAVPVDIFAWLVFFLVVVAVALALAWPRYSRHS